MAMLRLPALAAIQAGAIPRAFQAASGPAPRMPSPPLGSILITSAPCMASWKVPTGPAR